MKQFQEFYKAEELLYRLVYQDMIGPVSEAESISEAPLSSYSLGILWPQYRKARSIQKEMVAEEIDSEIVPDLDQPVSLEEEGSSTEDPLRKVNEYQPSSMAISVVVPKDTEVLWVSFQYARYSVREQRVTYEKKSKDADGKELIIQQERNETCYQREPVKTEKLQYSVKERRFITDTEESAPLKLCVFHRKVMSDGSQLITVSASNQCVCKNKEQELNTNAMFQCRMELSAEQEFCPIKDLYQGEQDEEVQKLHMLYRKTSNYAMGHGCSVAWDEKERRIAKVESKFLPRVELEQMAANPFTKFHCFQMKYWNLDAYEKGLKELEEFSRCYEDWMNGIQEKLHELGEHKEAAAESVKKIQQCIQRIRAGIEVLRTDTSARQAFLYTNEAMLLQRVNYGKTKGREIDEDSVYWYPFQLAYLLMILPDTVDGSGNWRDVVDLLWFPTGGGKTEAYFGVAVFTIFYRRLTKQSKAAGVTVIMRYTLRLLTAQQFERAAALICACEALRRKYRIGTEEISIGLWVGMDLTPNTLRSAKETIRLMKDGNEIYKSNPVQLFHCPYCGEELTVYDYQCEANMMIRCPSEDCIYHDRLPVYVVDEDIYEKRPTLLLSTVDKYARIVWEEKTAAVFSDDGRYLPPELIIQDELHLISGSLGSIDGLYETAVDLLCSKEGRKPKIIASTATVRNAVAQVKNLYNRRMFQFPPSGTDSEDSFFAEQVSKERKPARTYVGICETGGSILDAMIRVYGTMFFAVHYMKAIGILSKVIDQYWTVVGYYNALKDLGSASTVIRERVIGYAESLRLHKFRDMAEKAGMGPIQIGQSCELTSRKSSKKIKDTLEELEIAYPDERAYSYVLASNMLSVGIDINRLGAMLVYGQPKSNAEYIQATSRVGRNQPGIVFTLYHPMRSRDRSQYEQFQYYHHTFYQHVEAASVTPYSYRAVEKALHAVYVAMIRHGKNGLLRNDMAAQYDSESVIAVQTKKQILQRIEEIQPDAKVYAEEWLDCFEQEWEQAAYHQEVPFRYSLKQEQPEAVRTLLVEAEKENQSNFPSTLNALRNVEPGCNVYLMERGGRLDEE